MRSGVTVTDQKHALRVCPSEWMLALCLLALAAGGFLFSDYPGLRTITEAAFLTSIALAFTSLRSAFRTRTIGKAVLCCSTLFYYWLEAHYLVWTTPAFAVLSAPMSVSQYDPSLIQRGLLDVALFQIALLAGYSVNPRLSGLREWVRRRRESQTHFSMFARIVLMLSGILTLLLCYSFDLGVTFDAALASRSRAVLPSLDVGPLLYLGYFSFFAAAYFLIRVVVLKERGAWPVFCASAALLPPLLSGTRHYLLYVAIPVLAAVVTRIQGRVPRGRILKWCALGFLLLFVCQLQLNVRTVGWDHISEVQLTNITDLNVAYQFSAMLFALHLVPNQHEYFREFMEPHFLLYWIPRYFWPEKPVIESWTYYNETYTRGAVTWNVTPSVIGQFHMNFGLPGVIFAGIWLGFLTWLTDFAFSAIDVLTQPAVAAACGMSYAFICCSFRFYSPMYFSYFIFGVVGMFLITRSRALRRRTVAMGIPARAAA